MKKLLMMIGAAAVGVVANVALATDLDDYYFRYDFSSGAKVFCGSDAQPTDPMVSANSEKIDMTAFAVTGPDGENTAVHPMNTAWSSVSSDFINVLNADWTLAMSVRPGTTHNGVLFSIGRRAKNQKGISICSSSDTQQLIVDENIKNSSSTGSQRQNIPLDTGIDLTKGFHTVIVAYEKPASGNAGTIKLWVDGVFQKSLTTDNKQFGAGFQFCTTCSGPTTGETATTEDLDVAFRDVRFYSSAFTGLDVKRYAALYPADTLRPSAAVRSYGVNCIDTGYCTKQSTRYAIDFQFAEAENGKAIFGERGALGCFLFSNKEGHFAFIMKDNANDKMSGWGDFWVDTDTRRRFAALDSPNNSATLYYDGETSSKTLGGTANSTSAISMPLFAVFPATQGGAPYNYSKSLVYSMAVEEVGELKHFFAPYNDATLGACFKDIVTGELKGEVVESPTVALAYVDGFGAADDYKYENGTLYAKVYVASANAAKGAVALSLDGSALTPESDGGYWVAYGSVLTLTATPESGYDVSRWVGDVRMIQSGTASDAAITVKIDKAAQFEARFDVSADAEIFHSTAVGRFAKRAQDFDVGDYVQSDLILHFDGIRNAGADAPHSDDATMWANLGSLGSACDATIATLGSSIPSGAATGGWNENGYQFRGKNYFNIGDKVALGGAVTAQFAIDYDNTKQVASYPVLLGSTENDNDLFAVYSGTSHGRFCFKLFNGTTHQARAAYSGGGFVNAIYDNANMGVSIGESSAAGWQTSNVTGDLPAYSYAIGVGTSSDAQKAMRIFTGAVKSVRVYTQALDDEALAWNRFVDNVRFSDGEIDEDLIVSPNVRGLEGVEPSGEYMVNGSWTFTATNITDSVFTWSPVGYKLEKWDGSSWVFVKNEEGASFSYTNCTANGKMRLTWIWEQTGAVKGGYDVGDYVQDGLLLHFDGIRNAGADAPHSDDATTWANLVSGGAAATRKEIANPFSANWTSLGEWEDDCYVFRGKSYFELGDNLTLGKAATIQITAGFTPNETKTAWYPVLFGAIDEDVDNAVYFNENFDTREQRGYQYFKLLGETTHGSGAAWPSGARSSINAIYDAENARVSISTADGYRWQNANTTDSVGEKTYAIGTGCETDTANSKQRGMRAFVGRVSSVRVYNRVLSDFALTHNRAVDEVRFNGNVTIVNGAVGDTGTNGASSVADGVYDIASGTWTVTAPDVVEGGRRYRPRLTVETLTNGEWVRTNRIWTDSYTIDKSALGDDRIRLTWTWEIFKGLAILFR